MKEGPVNPGLPNPRGAEGLRAEEFCALFQAGFRTQWLLAISIVREASLAEDVVQEAGLIALGKLSHFEPGTNFSAWLGRMVRYVALNYARREQTRRSSPLDTVADPEDLRLLRRNNHEPAAFVRGWDARIEKELFGVGEVPRACLLLRTLEGLPYAEIAELLEIPEGTAMSHVHRTRLLLRERLSDLAPDADPRKSLT